MINLLDYNDFVRRSNNIGGYYLKYEMDKIIQTKLKEGYVNNDLIYTQDLRGIGKTYELIKFAKEQGLNVIISHSNIREEFKRKYNYANVYSERDEVLLRLYDKKCIIDEYVDIQLLKDKGFNIVTGFTNNRFVIKKEETIKVDPKNTDINQLTLDILDREIIQLGQKIEKTRTNEEYNTYKNLITSFREILKVKIDVLGNIHNKPITTKLYFNANMDEKHYVYYGDRCYGIKGNYNELADSIEKIINYDKNTQLYGDTNGSGLGIADLLTTRGYKIYPTTIVMWDYEYPEKSREWNQNYCDER